MEALVQFAQKAVIEHAGQVLLVQRPESDKYNPHMWECPGGRLQVGETLDGALCREAFEEVGLMVAPGKPLAVWSWTNANSRPIVCVARRCSPSSYGVRLSSEHSQFRWVPVDEILDMALIPNTYEPMREVVKELRKRDMRW
jgi:8-oxo-dGTP diphosphatase